MSADQLLQVKGFIFEEFVKFIEPSLSRKLVRYKNKIRTLRKKNNRYKCAFSRIST